jgi:2,4-dienoyl-CoA reductase-like NADH-dependent reductase (Old Yellow Enzyme family)
MTGADIVRSPIRIGRKQVKNRLFLSAHDTGLTRRGLPTDEMIAYYEARAKGSVGLVVIQAAAVHESAQYWSRILMADRDDIIVPYRRMVGRLRSFDAVVVGQLFHSGRLFHGRGIGGTLPVPIAPSVVPMEAAAMMPRAMTTQEVEETVAQYVAAARRLALADVDGIEVTAAHGYLPWQFLNPATNKRGDRFGGGFDERLIFVRELLGGIRRALGAERIVGLRVSADDGDPAMIPTADVVRICQILEQESLVDYFSFAFGNEGSHSGATHMIPPMDRPAGYVGPAIGRIREQLKTPVLAAGRINDAQTAIRILSEGWADMCGGARAYICDPDFAEKTVSGKFAEVRACIACNQACVGHLEAGYSISCIQYPESGRELEFPAVHRQKPQRKVLVIGGGPAGMKAAAVAAARGHNVVLREAHRQLGGQILLAQKLPRRAEFGGLITNLTRELGATTARVYLNSKVTAETIAADAPDVIVCAVGAQSGLMEIERSTDARVVDSWKVIEDDLDIGSRIAVYDWRADWIGGGVAEKLALQGCHVDLIVNGSRIGDHIQTYVRDMLAGSLHSLRVNLITYGRLFGMEDRTVYFQHSISGEPIIVEDVDALVVCGYHTARNELDGALSSSGVPVLRIGDALAPRTAEEAVLEGLRAARNV